MLSKKNTCPLLYNEMTILPLKRWRRSDAEGTSRREESVAAVGAFTRGVLWLERGCLDVREPRLPLACRMFLGDEACSTL